MSKIKLAKKRKKQLSGIVMAAGVMANTLVSAGGVFAEEAVSNTPQSNAVASNTLTALEKPTVETPYVYRSSVKGTINPNNAYHISDTENFEHVIGGKTNSSGNFERTASALDALSSVTNIKHVPGTTLYVRSVDTYLNPTQFSEGVPVLIHYPAPVVEPSYDYSQEITGTAYPNSEVYISNTEGFSGLVTVKTDGSGNFKVPASLLGQLPNYKGNTKLYFKSADSSTSPAMSPVVSTNIEGTQTILEKPVVETPYVYQTLLKGTTTPNTIILISNTENFEHYLNCKSNATGNFVDLASDFDELARVTNRAITPGTTLYVRSADKLPNPTNFSETVPVLIHYPAPVVEASYDYDQDITGTAYPNSEVYISDSEGSDNFITVKTDASGNFKAPVSLLKTLTNYKENNKLYFKNADSSTSPAMSSAVSTNIAVNQVTLEANDFTLEYGEAFDDSIAIKKSGAKATDKSGAAEEVKVKESNVDTTKPGEYSVTFVSDSGKEKTVKVTVNDAPAENATIEANDFTLEYGEAFDDNIAIKKSGATATDKYGAAEGVKVKESNVDTTKPGEYSVTFVSDSGKEKTIKVTVNPKKVIGSEPIIHATDMTYSVGETLNPLLGVTAEDPEDGDLTSQVKADAAGVNMSKVGDYNLKLSITDKDGNTTEKTVTIHVVDKISDGPAIKGAEDVRIDERSKFDPLKGISAEDSQGNDLTANLIYTGSVDTSTPGVYTLKYYVYDTNGKVATVTRKVTVQSDTSKPVVMSPDKLTIKQNSKFDPTLYAQAYDSEDGDLTDKISIRGQIYTDKIGSQLLTYEVIDSDGNKTSKQMEVDVVAVLGNAPIISGADDIKINVGDKFDPVSGVTAYDNEDGDLTSELKYGGIIDTGKAGEYTIIYTVWDSDFNTSTVQRTITVNDPTVEPTIEANDFTLEYGEAFDDSIAITKSGAKATDKYGAAEGVKVKESNVDPTKPGEYSVTFVSDSGKEKTIKVTVNDAPAENATIEANDFTLEYGEAFDDSIAITKSGAKATDKYGATEGVKVKESNVDPTKPGEYSVTFVSDSGKEKTIKVTVNDAPAENATIEANDFTLEYGEAFDDSIAITKSGAKATDKYGATEGVKVKESNVDPTKPGEYSVTFVSDSGKEKTIKVTVNDAPAENATIEANDFTLEYGEAFDDSIAITKSGAKATDKYGATEGVKVKESNVDPTKPGEYSVTFVSDSGKEKTVKVTVKAEAPTKPTVDTIKAGAGKVTGTGKPGNNIVITVGGKEVGRGTVTDNGTFEILTGTYRAKVGDVYNVYAQNEDDVKSEAVNASVVATSGQLTPNDYTIGELSITGTYTGDITTIAVYVDGIELGKTTGENVKDGKFNFYVGSTIKSGQKVTVVGYDKYGKRLDEKTVKVSDSLAAPTVNDVHEGDTTITGTGDAGSIIYVKDSSKNIIGQAVVKTDGTYEITIPAQSKDKQLVVMAKRGDIRSAEVKVTVLAALPEKPFVNAVKEGAGKITGNAQLGETITITLNGKVVGQGEVNADGTFSILLSSKAKAGNVYEITATNKDGGSSLATKVTATITVGTVAPNPFTLGNTTFTGTFTGDVSSIDLVIDGTSQGVVSGNSVKNGVFSYYVGSLSIQKDQTIEVIAYDTYGKKLDQKTVTIN